MVISANSNICVDYELALIASFLRYKGDYCLFASLIIYYWMPAIVNFTFLGAG